MNNDFSIKEFRHSLLLSLTNLDFNFNPPTLKICFLNSIVVLLFARRLCQPRHRTVFLTVLIQSLEVIHLSC